MKKIGSWLVVAAICVLVTGALGAFKYGQIRAAIAFAESFPEPSETVQVENAEEILWTPTVSVVGEVVPTRSVELRNELAGMITEVGFEPGARVSKGQVLLRLDIREEQAQLAAAEAQAELAALVLKRNESLTATSAVSKQAADTARAERDAAVATANRLRTIIDKKTLTAPFDAIASLHELQPGQFLDAGSRITWLVGISGETWIDFSLPQEQAALGVGDSVTLGREAGDTAPRTARIIARNPFVDQASRNVRFRALADNADGGLEPGAIVTVHVPVGDAKRVLRVPATAIRRDAFGTSVFVLVPAEAGADAPDRASRRPVSVERIDGRYAYIRSGLEAGERVAADGAFKLRDGLLVRSRVAAASTDTSPRQP